jgi:hypothetical protein
VRRRPRVVLCSLHKRAKALIYTGLRRRKGRGSNRGSGLCVLFVQSKLRGERRLYDVLVQSDDSGRREHLHPTQ